jgi:cytohesin
VYGAVFGILLICQFSICLGTEAPDTRPAALDIGQINKAAIAAKSLFLDDDGRIHAVDTFQRLVRVKGPSGQEQQIREEVQRMLTQAGAAVVPAKSNDREAPLNLIMEIPGSGDLAGRPGILLNAHLDTIARSTQEFLAFDDSTGDFYHLHATESGKSSSFGGDDRSAVAVIVETIRLLQANYWSRGVAHRRILLVFTADEERGCVGAAYLSQHEPDLFADLAISLSIDGPLDLNSDYPRDSFVAVVSESDSTIVPYKHVLELMQEFCGRTGARFGRTEYGLGRGDFAHFPSSARAGLHLRAAVRGFHSRERVNVRDLINQIDLLCYLLLDWDPSRPLHKAAADGDVGVVKSLVEKGDEVDKRENIFLRTALHRAVAAGNREVAELVLSYGANPNARDNGGFSALHYAAINDNRKMVELLIAKEADVNAKDASGNTPLYSAVRSGHKDIAEMLLEKGAEISIHVAAFLGHIEDIKNFVETGTSIDANDSRGFTPLHYAVIQGHYDTAKFLIAKGAHVNVKDIWPFGTPLHCAVENGHKEIVELLAAAGADVNARRRRPAGDAPLHSAVRGGHNDIVGILASRGADLNMKDNSGQIPLDIAISQNRKDIVELLLAKGAEVPSIHTAVRMGNVESVKAFFEKGTNINEKDGSGLSPLHIAVSGSSKEVVEFLLAEGADVNAKDKGGYTPLNYAIWNRNKDMPRLPADMVKLLLEKGADTNLKDTASGYTSLHWAIVMWGKELAELVVAAGADVNARSNTGETPLDVVAAEGGPAAIGELLVAKGAEVSSLHAAAYVGDLAKAKAFIDEGVEVNRPSGMVGGTALHAAAAKGHTEVAEFLIDKGADVNAQTRAGQTPLHTAVGAGHLDVAELLVNKGADVNMKDSRGRTPLSLAEKASHTEIVEFLRKHGAKE